MDRLQGTNSSAVALNCLIAVHHIINHGSFVLRDQFSVYPSTGGRNYLNLSNFRHDTDPISWELSSWVRWFAQHEEQLLCTSRILGFFFLGNSPDDREERVSGLANDDLLTEFDSLVTLVEGICKRPDGTCMNLVGDDWIMIERKVCDRVREFKERLSWLKFGEAVEVVCCLKRLQECKERMMMMLEVAQGQGLWDLVREVKEKTWMEAYKVHKEVTKRKVSESCKVAIAVAP